ncbi:MAG: excinuclease ABC subunit UvrA, partial [Clostridia bacterium]|nr:excinuclease ABC subunit UvrA [Clostridia bacterium]
SLSSYARMFLGQLDKPDVDSVEGLSPAIAIDQKTTSKNPRSTVGTVTEIYDYLRLLYARIGVPHCPVCGREIRQRSVDQVLDAILTMPEGERFLVLAPVVRGKKGRHEKVFADALKNGFVRASVDGVICEITDEMDLDKNKKHDIDLVIDRLVLRPDIRPRLSDSVETALRESDGIVRIRTVPREGEGKVTDYSTLYACPEHGTSFGEKEPRLFSFNNPFGACPHCLGIGVMRTVSPAKILPDKRLSLEDGGVQVNGFKSLGPDSWTGPLLAAVGKKHGFTMQMPLKDFSAGAMKALLYGTGSETYDVVRYFGGTGRRSFVTWEGVIPIIDNRVNMNGEEAGYYEQFMEETDCPECRGKRLNPAALSVTVGGLDITSLCDLSIAKALDFLENLPLDAEEAVIAREIMKELRSRLRFLLNVGLEYLTLSRRAGTLSGGEAQRIRLATQVGSSLTGVMYVLDEPSIGLHQRDNGRLISTLKGLRDLGNSVLVVEHDEETMRSTDYIVDIGPGAGVHG